MANADTTSPTLTGLVLPKTIDVTSGGQYASFSANATDVGTGVSYVGVYLDHALQTQNSNTTYLYFGDSSDSFSDGVSNISQYINSTTAAGTYGITQVYVYDKAGNYTSYSASQLNSLGVSASFQVIDRNAAVTADVTAPTSVTEGTNTSASLSLVLHNVTTASGTVTLSFDTANSTANNGTDVSVPTYSSSYNVSQSTKGDYTFALPAITIFDDTLQEGTETIAIRVAASGQIFSSGTDSIVVTVPLLDNDLIIRATPGNHVIAAGAGNDTLVLLGARSSYEKLVSGDATYLIGPEGGYKISGVEQITFTDATVSFADAVKGASAFDGLRYIASYADLIVGLGANADAGAAHYLSYGFAEGRKALAFDAREYLASNRDLAVAFGDNASAATRHFISYGYGEHRQVASFDPLEYLASNRDVVSVFGDDTAAAVSHYIAYGAREGRATDSFDATEYLASNRDLVLAFGNDPAAGRKHYVDYGIRESRPTGSFDATEYLASNRDLALAFGNNPAAGLKHYLDYGAREGRSTASFDTRQYLATNPDVLHLYGDDPAAATKHYLDYGAKEGRLTSGFDPVAYLLSNADLQQAGLGANGALQHWLDYGVNEGRGGDAAFGREQAGHTLVVGGTANAALDSAGDHDWFGTTLRAGQHASLAFHSSTVDATIEVHDAAGHLLQAFHAGHDGSVVLTGAASGDVYFTVADPTGGVGAYTIDLIAG